MPVDAVMTFLNPQFHIPVSKAAKKNFNHCSTATQMKPTIPMRIVTQQQSLTQNSNVNDMFQLRISTEFKLDCAQQVVWCADTSCQSHEYFIEKHAINVLISRQFGPPHLPDTLMITHEQCGVWRHFVVFGCLVSWKFWPQRASIVLPPGGILCLHKNSRIITFIGKRHQTLHQQSVEWQMGKNPKLLAGNPFNHN